MDIRKYSFCNRVVNSWNNLPDLVVNAGSVQEFEWALDLVWREQNKKYEYTAEIINSLDHRHDHTTTHTNICNEELESQAL